MQVRPIEMDQTFILIRDPGMIWNESYSFVDQVSLYTYHRCFNIDLWYIEFYQFWAETIFCVFVHQKSYFRSWSIFCFRLYLFDDVLTDQSSCQPSSSSSSCQVLSYWIRFISCAWSNPFRTRSFYSRASWLYKVLNVRILPSADILRRISKVMRIFAFIKWFSSSTLFWFPCFRQRPLLHVLTGVGHDLTTLSSDGHRSYVINAIT